MTIGILPKRYASALLALATQADKVDKVASDLRDFLASWNDAADLRGAFQNPENRRLATLFVPPR